MLQGTSSHVGKSVLAAGLCRLLYRDGYRVAPFKAQNMALNSYVTATGGEMGRAQVVQAEACGLAPRVEMNPILLKPTADASSQVIVLGRPVANLGAWEYHREFNLAAMKAVEEAFQTLASSFEVVVIEGAGSPAEVNLKDRDIANMRTARMAAAAVLLVADIDRGGALASVVGTLELLEEEERRWVAGIIFNKFRGDRKLLAPALDFIEAKTGCPVLGVVPFVPNLGLDDEDSVSLEDRPGRASGEAEIVIAVVSLPHISNFTDFAALAAEPGCQVRYSLQPEEAEGADLVIIPGTKNTLDDLRWLKKTGWATWLQSWSGKGGPLIGICGGFQMLGQKLSDPQGVEGSGGTEDGLGLLPVTTFFDLEKVTRQVKAEVAGDGVMLGPCRGETVTGYEIHQGRSLLLGSGHPAFRLSLPAGPVSDGAEGSRGLVWGSYLHGVLDNDVFRRHLVNFLRERRGLAPLTVSVVNMAARREQAFDRWANVLQESLDLPRIYEITGLRAC